MIRSSKKSFSPLRIRRCVRVMVVAKERWRRSSCCLAKMASVGRRDGRGSIKRKKKLVMPAYQPNDNDNNSSELCPKVFLWLLFPCPPYLWLWVQNCSLVTQTLWSDDPCGLILVSYYTGSIGIELIHLHHLRTHSRSVLFSLASTSNY